MAPPPRPRIESAEAESRRIEAGEIIDPPHRNSSSSNSYINRPLQHRSLYGATSGTSFLSSATSLASARPSHKYQSDVVGNGLPVVSTAPPGASSSSSYAALANPISTSTTNNKDTIIISSSSTSSEIKSTQADGTSIATKHSLNQPVSEFPVVSTRRLLIPRDNDYDNTNNDRFHNSGGRGGRGYDTGGGRGYDTGGGRGYDKGGGRSSFASSGGGRRPLGVGRGVAGGRNSYGDYNSSDSMREELSSSNSFERRTIAPNDDRFGQRRSSFSNRNENDGVAGGRGFGRGTYRDRENSSSLEGQQQRGGPEDDSGSVHSSEGGGLSSTRERVGSFRGGRFGMARGGRFSSSFDGRGEGRSSFVDARGGGRWVDRGAGVGRGGGRYGGRGDFFNRRDELSSSKQQPQSSVRVQQYSSLSDEPNANTSIRGTTASLAVRGSLFEAEGRGSQGRSFGDDRRGGSVGERPSFSSDDRVGSDDKEDHNDREKDSIDPFNTATSVNKSFPATADDSKQSKRKLDEDTASHKDYPPPEPVEKRVRGTQSFGSEGEIMSSESIPCPEREEELMDDQKFVNYHQDYSSYDDNNSGYMTIGKKSRPLQQPEHQSQPPYRDFDSRRNEAFSSSRTLEEQLKIEDVTTPATLRERVIETDKIFNNEEEDRSSRMPDEIDGGSEVSQPRQEIGLRIEIPSIPCAEDNDDRLDEQVPARPSYTNDIARYANQDDVEEDDGDSSFSTHRREGGNEKPEDHRHHITARDTQSSESDKLQQLSPRISAKHIATWGSVRDECQPSPFSVRTSSYSKQYVSTDSGRDSPRERSRDRFSMRQKDQSSTEDHAPKPTGFGEAFRPTPSEMDSDNRSGARFGGGRGRGGWIDMAGRSSGRAVDYAGRGNVRGRGGYFGRGRGEDTRGRDFRSSAFEKSPNPLSEQRDGSAAGIGLKPWQKQRLGNLPPPPPFIPVASPREQPAVPSTIDQYRSWRDQHQHPQHQSPHVPRSQTWGRPSPTGHRQRYEDHRQHLSPSPPLLPQPPKLSITTTSYVEAAIALERRSPSPPRPPPPRAPTPPPPATPPPEPSEPSGLTLAITRLADLQAQMDYEFAKYTQLVLEQKILKVQSDHLETLQVGMDAFIDDLEKLLAKDVDDKNPETFNKDALIVQ